MTMMRTSLSAAVVLMLSSGAVALVPPTPGFKKTLTRTSMAALSPEEDNLETGFPASTNGAENSTPTILPSTTAPRQVRKKSIVMSQSVPFLQCPEPLLDCDFAGNVQFDPLGLAKNKEQLWEYREAEMKHARLAMLAAIGWPASEMWDRAIASQFQLDPVLDDTGRAPSLLNGGMDRVSPIWWGFCIGLTAAIEMYGLAKARRGDVQYAPGKLGFDPMGMYPADAKGQRSVEEAEIKNGRLAMLAVVSYVWEEWTTKMAVVDETPWFFGPIASSVGMVEEAVVEESPWFFSPLADAFGHLAFE